MNSSKFPPPLAEELGLGASGARNGHRPPPRFLTDLGNAERLVDRHGEDLHYLHPWGSWLVWDGRRHLPDQTGTVERLMKGTARRIYAEAEHVEDSQERKAIADHAKRSEGKKRISDAIALARSEPGIPILPGDLDRDPWLLNAENGTVDLRTGGLREHRREDLITKLAPVEYDPEAEAPIWEKFLARILPSERLRRFLQKAIGYAALGVSSEEILVILHGVGDNGKTTLVNAVMEALGEYAMPAAPDLLLAKRGSHPTELADLFGARFVASVETDEGRRMNEALVKQLTGRDPIKARRMREDFWQFDPTHTVFLATNHKPEVRGTDHAIWRRIKLAPFEVKIPEKEKDRKLQEKLRAELPGILAWIVRGCLAYQQEGLGEPEEVRDATKGYRVEMDVLGGFIEDCCKIGDDNLWVKFADLWSAYTSWCEESNEKAEKKRKFADLLTERGFDKDHGTNNVAIRRGIALRYDGGPDPSRINDPGPQESPETPASGSDSEEIDNSDAEELTIDNSQKPCKSGESDEGINEDYRDSDISGKKRPHGSLTQKVVNDRSFDNSAPSTPRESRRLTPEEAERVKRLVGEGMGEDAARAQVLGESFEEDLEDDLR